MIYRELRNLSAPQKQERFNELQEKYKCSRPGVAVECGVMDVIATCKGAPPPGNISDTRKLIAAYNTMHEGTMELIREELYDLAVFLYHYEHIDEAYKMFTLLLKMNPNFPEAYWGLGTAARHTNLTLLSPTQKTTVATRLFKTFVNFKTIGAFWKKRAQDLVKQMQD